MSETPEVKTGLQDSMIGPLGIPFAQLDEILLREDSLPVQLPAYEAGPNSHKTKEEEDQAVADFVRPINDMLVAFGIDHENWATSVNKAATLAFEAPTPMKYSDAVFLQRDYETFGHMIYHVGWNTLPIEYDDEVDAKVCFDMVSPDGYMLVFTFDGYSWTPRKYTRLSDGAILGRDDPELEKLGSDEVDTELGVGIRLTASCTIMAREKYDAEISQANAAYGL